MAGPPVSRYVISCMNHLELGQVQRINGQWLRNIENKERKVVSFLRSHFGPIIKLENSPRLWSLVLKSQSPFMVLGLEWHNPSGSLSNFCKFRASRQSSSQNFGPFTLRPLMKMEDWKILLNFKTWVKYWNGQQRSSIAPLPSHQPQWRTWWRPLQRYCPRARTSFRASAAWFRTLNARNQMHLGVQYIYKLLKCFKLA